ncbi:glycine N-acyltransferase-like protein 3 [Alligator mississippiensis]|uniref:glycine N-acyltransferase-like protein 3 n=1 Tax=Alligator mississippiensis TaxID=8496 RepID=UPI0009071EF1|nr:glycine N-acyltransferase-like protein 3 [Alligator mississippiensis]
MFHSLGSEAAAAPEAEIQRAPAAARPGPPCLPDTPSLLCSPELPQPQDRDSAAERSPVPCPEQPEHWGQAGACTLFAGGHKDPVQLAMLILSCSSKLQLLEGVLQQGLPKTLPVHGSVMNINRGNPSSYEVLVDSWPDFKAVLVRPRKEVVTDKSDVFTNMHAAFYRDLGAYRALLDSPGAINWGHTIYIIGLQDGLYEASRDVAKAKGVQVNWQCYFTFFHPDPSTMPDIWLDPTMKLSSLNASHVDLLNATWAYGGNERSRRYLARLIRSFPSTCLLDATGCPISWNITDQFGTTGHGYTLPEYRSHGYNSIVAIVTSKRLHAQGYPSFGYTSLDNYPMQRLQVSHGFRLLPSLSYFINHHPTPRTVPS